MARILTSRFASLARGRSDTSLTISATAVNTFHSMVFTRRCHIYWLSVVAILIGLVLLLAIPPILVGAYNASPESSSSEALSYRAAGGWRQGITNWQDIGEQGSLPIGTNQARLKVEFNNDGQSDSEGGASRQMMRTSISGSAQYLRLRIQGEIMLHPASSAGN